MSRKVPELMMAKDLYRSPWFAKARTWAEANGDEWWILSAKHHLLHPDSVIAPYEMTLNNQPRQHRQAWAQMVLGQLAEHYSQPVRLVILAGARYREFLVPQLSQHEVVCPLAGLGIGQQLAWLGRGAWIQRVEAGRP